MTESAPAQLVPPLLAWFRAHRRDLPWRRTREPYAVWVSEVMLQQTQVATVIPYWERWMTALPDIKALAMASSERVLKLWEGLGYYSRARNLQRAARMIVQQHGGRFPSAFSDALELPGIGRYTAGAVCSIAFGQPTPIVDGNVIRVLARLFALPGNPKESAVNARLWSLAQDLVSAAAPDRSCGDLNQALMELGALVCLPRQPACATCPVQQRCVAFQTGSTDRFPELPPRAASTRRLYRAALLRRDGKIWLRRRAVGLVNEGFWELPNTEVTARQTVPASLALAAGCPVAKPRLVCTIQHTITRYRNTLQVFAAQLPSGQDPRDGAWFSLEALEGKPLQSAHRRALEQCGLLPANISARAPI